MQHSIYSSKYWLEYLRKKDEELLRLARVDIFKATGKGGQKKNKTSNAVRLTLSYLSVTETSSRSKTENVSGAVKKLRTAIALDTEKAKENRGTFRSFPMEIHPYINCEIIRINPKNPVFPIFIGCLIDVFITCEGKWNAIGKKFGTTTSQIRKFVDKNGFLIATLNGLKKQLEAM